MKQPKSMKSLEELGRVRLSGPFFMRDFLHSEISNFYSIPNIPDNPDLAIAAGTKLCAELLEPLTEVFGGISIRSAYRSCAVNDFGNKNDLNCATNEKNFGRHIWDRRDRDGHMGATACIIVRRFIPVYEATGNWQPLAWWIHDNLPYSELQFFPKYAAFNISWHEVPKRTIYSYIDPKGCLTKPGMKNNQGSHKALYKGLP